MCMPNCVYDFYVFLSLSTYDTAYKIWLTCLLYTGKFSRFLEPVTVQENTLYTCRSFFDIYHNLMFEASFVLEPCNFSILLLKCYKHR